MHPLFLSLFLLALISSFAEGSLKEGSPRRPKNQWKTRGQGRRNRQLHVDYGAHGGGKGSTKDSHDGARSNGGIFNTGTGRSTSGKGGASKGHMHVTTPGYAAAREGTPATGSTATIYSSLGYTTETFALTTYNNKCDAAEAGAEYRTNSYIPVYYQYEVMTSSTRNILEIADIIDKASQHFLAVWMVDCPDGGGRKRQRNLLQSHRTLQQPMLPIVGVGVGDWDTVLLGGTVGEECQTLPGSVAIGQACYKVIGSLLVYLDETMQVTPYDVQRLTVETLLVGMNYGTTDFTQLDQDIYELQFIQGYASPPADLLESNKAVNQRSWDTSNQDQETALSSTEAPASLDNESRSGGAKFGIAFATLVCIAIAAFVAVYLYKNQDSLFNNKGGGGKQRKHHNLDEQTQASTRYDPKKARVVTEDAASHGEVNVTFRSHGGSRSPDSESVATRPLSPELETPPPPAMEEHYRHDRSPTIMKEDSNIITPRSDWSLNRSSISLNRSSISEITEPAPMMMSTPDDRSHIRISGLTKDKLRNSSKRKPAPRAYEYVSPDRSYQIDDTVDL